MPNYVQLARQAANEVGVPAKIFVNLVRAESGFRPDAGSPAGAQGLTQLMPGTAHGLSTKYGIDTNTPYGNLLGGAYYLKEQLTRFKDPRLALAAYNAGPGAVERYGDVPPYKETQAYVNKILKGGMGGMGGGGGSTGFGTAGLPSGSSTGLQSALLQNLSSIGMTGRIDPVQMLQGIAAGIAAGRPTMTPVPTVFPSTFGRTTGKVTVSPGANRAGVGINPAVISFVQQVSSVDGKPLTIGTGTNHNQFVIGTRRQSAHWTGNAADIPASGADLTRLGRAALVAAGMSPAQAARQRGGVYNLGGYQVIFNSHVGGNHFTHLHVGLSG